MNKEMMIAFVLDMYSDTLSEEQLAQFKNDLMNQDDTSVRETYVKNGGK